MEGKPVREKAVARQLEECQNLATQVAEDIAEIRLSLANGLKEGPGTVSEEKAKDPAPSCRYEEMLRETACCLTTAHFAAQDILARLEV